MSRPAPWQQRPLTILGSTGSIGCSALEVCNALAVPLHALTAHRSVETLAAQALRHRPRLAVIADPARHADLRTALAGSGIATAAGPEALSEAAAEADCAAVLTAVVGAAGLPATLAAVRAGKRVCIANKEPLVMAGQLITTEARRCGATLLPVDSEHSAIFQCLAGHGTDEVAGLILTGSGGPFRTVADLGAVTREQALAHPTWSMGPKITIDSATLMNKALELIEARWLFDIEAERIELLIHPQSVIHSMVAFRGGSVMAQLGRPDMRTPIQLALSWPQHTAGPVAAPDFAALGQLDFEEPDRSRFPFVDLGYAAAAAGGLVPVAMNAANEVAVERFLAGEIPFTGIFRLVEAALAACPGGGEPDLAAITEADAEVRRRTKGV